MEPSFDLDSNTGPRDYTRIGLHLAAASLLALNVAIILAWPLARGQALRDSLSPVYAGLCHQLPSRTLHLAGEPMPVCARCLGFWTGLALAAAAAALGADRAAPWKSSTACCLMAVMLLDWCLGCAGLPVRWHLERTVAGALGGIGTYMLAVQLCTRLLRRMSRSRAGMGRMLDAMTHALGSGSR